jgi:hypothetical protein
MSSSDRERTTPYRLTLREWRAARGLTQFQLAAAAGVGLSSVPISKLGAKSRASASPPDLHKRSVSLWAILPGPSPSSFTRVACGGAASETCHDRREERPVRLLRLRPDPDRLQPTLTDAGQAAQHHAGHTPRRADERRGARWSRRSND